jgi:hypothetical protein
VRRGLLWLALVDLRQAWPRPGLTASAIALAVLAIAFFARQIELRRAEVLAGYESVGAATFIVRLSGIADDQIDGLAASIRRLRNIGSVEAPYSGISGRILADTSFLVFRNERQREYLGARTSVLGVDPNFDLARDYYVDFRDVNPAAPDTVLGIPLLGTAGTVHAPQRGEVLVPSGIAEYVGVRPGAEATVELVYTGRQKLIGRRFESRLIGTFDAVGPDQGRFDPFWRFNSLAHDVLTVRPPAGTGSTTLPIVVNQQVIRELLSVVSHGLDNTDAPTTGFRSRGQLVVRADSISKVPLAEAAVERLLRKRGLDSGCDPGNSGSFCLVLPERNNFRAALEQQTKVGTGGAFFIALLLAILGIGTAGSQIQTVISRWRDYGVLQALGFTPGQLLVYSGLELALVLGSGIAIAAGAALVMPFASASSLLLAMGCTAMAAATASLVVAWPLRRPVAELVREA